MKKVGSGPGNRSWKDIDHRTKTKMARERVTDMADKNLSSSYLQGVQQIQKKRSTNGSTLRVQSVYDIYDCVKHAVSDNRPASEIVPTCASGIIWITLPFEVSVASQTLSGCAKPLANDTNTAAQ